MHTSIAHQGFSFRSWVTMGKTLPWNAFSQSTKTVPSNRHMPVNGLSGSPIPILKQYDGELYTWIWLTPLGVNFPFVISLDSRVISILVSAHSYPKYSIATQVWTCHSNDVTENDEYTEKPGDSPYLEITLCCLENIKALAKESSDSSSHLMSFNQNKLPWSLGWITHRKY